MVRTDESGIRLRVEDSGPGLSDSDLRRLNNDSSESSGAAKASAGWAGLGWSIVRRIASAQRAIVQVSRSPELGDLRTESVWPHGS